MILTSYSSALDMLTMPLVSLSKPVGPNMLMNFFLGVRAGYRLYTVLASIPNAPSQK